MDADADLVARCKNGDAAAFSVLVRRHTPRLYAVAFALLRNPTDASDVVQDAFLNAWKNLATFRGDAAFASWLSRIAENAALMRLRTRRRHPEAPLVVPGPDFDDAGHIDRDIEDFSARVEVAIENRELGAVLSAAMDELPDSYRAVFVLADLEHRSMKEIADALDLTVPNVKTRLHRARLKLRATLETYLAGEGRAP